MNTQTTFEAAFAAGVVGTTTEVVIPAENASAVSSPAGQPAGEIAVPPTAVTVEKPAPTEVVPAQQEAAAPPATVEAGPAALDLSLLTEQECRARLAALRLLRKQRKLNGEELEEYQALDERLEQFAPAAVATAAPTSIAKPEAADPAATAYELEQKSAQAACDRLKRMTKLRNSGTLTGPALAAHEKERQQLLTQARKLRHVAEKIEWLSGYDRFFENPKNREIKHSKDNFEIAGRHRGALSEIDPALAEIPLDVAYADVLGWETNRIEARLSAMQGRGLKTPTRFLRDIAAFREILSSRMGKKKPVEKKAAPETVAAEAPAAVVEAVPETAAAETPATVVQAVPETVTAETPATVVQAVPETVTAETPATVVQAVPETVAAETPAPVVEAVPETVAAETPATVVDSMEKFATEVRSIVLAKGNAMMEKFGRTTTGCSNALNEIGAAYKTAETSLEKLILENLESLVTATYYVCQAEEAALTSEAPPPDAE